MRCQNGCVECGYSFIWVLSQPILHDRCRVQTEMVPIPGQGIVRLPGALQRPVPPLGHPTPTSLASPPAPCPHISLARHPRKRTPNLTARPAHAGPKPTRENVITPMPPITPIGRKARRQSPNLQPLPGPPPPLRAWAGGTSPPQKDHQKGCIHLASPLKQAQGHAGEPRPPNSSVFASFGRGTCSASLGNPDEQRPQGHRRYLFIFRAGRNAIYCGAINADHNGRGRHRMQARETCIHEF